MTFCFAYECMYSYILFSIVIVMMTGLVMERSVLPTSALVTGLLWIVTGVVLAAIMEAHKLKNYFKQKSMLL